MNKDHAYGAYIKKHLLPAERSTAVKYTHVVVSAIVWGKKTPGHAIVFQVVPVSSLPSVHSQCPCRAESSVGDGPALRLTSGAYELVVLTQYSLLEMGIYTHSLCYWETSSFGVNIKLSHFVLSWLKKPRTVIKYSVYSEILRWKLPPLC